MEKKNYIVGIDIGSSNIVMVVGSKNAEGKMCIDMLVEKSTQGVNAGVIENINQVSECVKAVKLEVEEKLGIRVSEAYASISGAFVRCDSLSDHVYVRDPQNGISQFDVDALFLRMKEVIAPDPDKEIIIERIPQNFVVDGGQEVKDPVGSFGRCLSSTFNFILCEKTPLERVKMVFRISGLQLAGVYANPMIMSESILSEDEKTEGVAVVDLGGHSTDVAVYHNNIIRHIATIPMGANSINRDIHLHGVPERSVESLKKKYGSAVAEFVSEQKLIQIPSMGHRTKGVLRRNLAAIIEARLTDIAEFVKAEIKDSGYANRLSFGIVLTGGSASIEHIDELFRRVTGFDVRIATAECGLDEESSKLIDSPAYTAAISLLLKGAEQGACAVSPKPMSTTATRPTVPTFTPQPIRTPAPEATTAPAPTTSATPAPSKPEGSTETKTEEGETTQAEQTTQTTTAATGAEPKSGWLGNLLKKVTDGINNTFDKAGDDDEI